jgi:hypothetical protein
VHEEIVMLRVIVTASVFIFLAACSTMSLVRVRCDAHLVPINQPAVERAGNKPGEKP